jgi:hypothetical protein
MASGIDTPNIETFIIPCKVWQHSQYEYMCRVWFPVRKLEIFFSPLFPEWNWGSAFDQQVLFSSFPGSTGNQNLLFTWEWRIYHCTCVWVCACWCMSKWGCMYNFDKRHKECKSDFLKLWHDRECLQFVKPFATARNFSPSQLTLIEIRYDVHFSASTPHVILLVANNSYPPTWIKTVLPLCCLYDYTGQYLHTAGLYEVQQKT